MSTQLEKGILFHCDVIDVADYTSERFTYWPCKEYPEEQAIERCEPYEASFWGVYNGEQGEEMWVADCDSELTAKAYVKLLSDTVKEAKKLRHERSH
jgi:hypothetical protein